MRQQAGRDRLEAVGGDRGGLLAVVIPDVLDLLSPLAVIFIEKVRAQGRF